MVNRKTKRTLLAVSVWIVALSFFGLLSFVNLSFDSKVFNFIQLKTIFAVLLGFVGLTLLKEDLI